MKSPINNITMPKQRVSDVHKASSQWTQEMADYVVAVAKACNNKSIIRDFLDAANGRYNKEQYEYVFKTYKTDGATEDEKLAQTLISDLREFDLLSPIKDRYLGEFATSYDNFQIYSDDPSTIISRNKAFGDKVMGLMEQQLINELNKRGTQTNQESKEVPDVESMLKDFIEQWDLDRVESAQHRLNLLNNEIDAKLKYNQLYYYYWACEQCYTYRYIHNNRVYFEVVSPLEYYRVPSESTFVEDDAMGCRIFTASLQYIINRFGQYLTPSDKKLLDVISDRKGLDHVAYAELIKSRLIEHDPSSKVSVPLSNIASTIASGHSVYNNHDQITVAHYFFTGERKVGYLKYYDEFGMPSERVVDEDYVLDVEHGDISITWDWIFQKYEGEIIGLSDNVNTKGETIYTAVRPIQVQRELFTDINVTKAPYNGISYVHKDSTPNPIPYRLIPYAILYRIYAYQMEKAIQTWKSFIFVPESILSESDEFTSTERLARANSENMFVFNDANVSQQALNAIKEVATQATYNHVQTLKSLQEGLKMEAWEVVNMTPSRMGNQKAYQGKSVTESALEQGQISSSWTLDMFNLFRGVDYLANYDYSRVAWSDGKSGSYIDESTHESHFIEVDPFEHLAMNIGIHVGNSKLYEEKLQAIKQLGMSFAQGGDNDTAIASILNDNFQVIEKKIKEATKLRKAFEQQMQDSKNQAMIQAEQIKAQSKQNELDYSLQEANIASETSINVELIKQQTALLQIAEKLQVDTNGNGYIDKNEAYNTAMRDLSVKQTELGIKLENQRLQREKFEYDKAHPKGNS